MSGARGLMGVRVAVTRPEEAAAELVAGLAERGAEVRCHPLIRIAPPEDAAPLAAAAARVAGFEWVVFTSANGVRAFHGALQAAGRSLRGGGPRVAAVGPATAAALEVAGIAVDLLPGEFLGRSLPAAMARLAPVGGARVLLPRSQIGREELPALLRAAGAEVVDVVAYRTLPDEEGAAALERELSDGRVDMLTFTSPSAIRTLAAVCPRLPPGVRVVVIGPVTAAAAREAGYPVDVVPEEYSAGGLLAALDRIMPAGA